MDSEGRVIKDYYNSADLAENYYFLKLATDYEIIKLVSNYLGCVPIIQYLASWITYKHDEELNEMFFHMDHHGHKFLKLFFLIVAQ